MSICAICLRPDRKLKSIEGTLSCFHAQLCDFSFLQVQEYCLECEWTLRKLYNFKLKCIRADKLLRDWKGDMSLKDLHTLLPQSHLSVWSNVNSKLYTFKEDQSFRTYLRKHSKYYPSKNIGGQTTFPEKHVNNIIPRSNFKIKLPYKNTTYTVRDVEQDIDFHNIVVSGNGKRQDLTTASDPINTYIPGAVDPLKIEDTVQEIHEISIKILPEAGGDESDISDSADQSQDDTFNYYNDSFGAESENSIRNETEAINNNREIGNVNVEQNKSTVNNAHYIVINQGVIQMRPEDNSSASNGKMARSAMQNNNFEKDFINSIHQYSEDKSITKSVFGSPMQPMLNEGVIQLRPTYIPSPNLIRLPSNTTQVTSPNISIAKATDDNIIRVKVLTDLKDDDPIQHDTPFENVAPKSHNQQNGGPVNTNVKKRNKNTSVVVVINDDDEKYVINTPKNVVKLSDSKIVNNNTANNDSNKQNAVLHEDLNVPSVYPVLGTSLVPPQKEKVATTKYIVIDAGKITETVEKETDVMEYTDIEFIDDVMCTDNKKNDHQRDETVTHDHVYSKPDIIENYVAMETIDDGDSEVSSVTSNNGAMNDVCPDFTNELEYEDCAMSEIINNESTINKDTTDTISNISNSSKDNITESNECDDKMKSDNDVNLISNSDDTFDNTDCDGPQFIYYQESNENNEDDENPVSLINTDAKRTRKQKFRHYFKLWLEKVGDLKNKNGDIIPKQILFHYYCDIEYKAFLTLEQAVRGDTSPYPSRHTIDTISEIYKKHIQPYTVAFDTIFLKTAEEVKHEFLERRTYECYTRAKFKCHICYRGFNRERMLAFHNQVHDPTNGSFSCSLCQFWYKDEKMLRKHKSTHFHVYKCRICPKVYYSRPAVLDHHRLHLGNKITCQICHTQYQTRAWYYVHIKSHQNYRCILCKVTCENEKGLRYHSKKEHDGSNMWVWECKDCVTRFSSAASLKRHVCKSPRDPTMVVYKPKRTRRKRQNYSHGPPKMKTCTICQKEVSIRRMYWHVKLEHPEAPYQRPEHGHLCDTCGNTFKDFTMLTDHLRRHGGEREFECEHCESRFYTQRELNSHQVFHNPPTVPCTRCDKKFYTKTHLCTHMQSHLRNYQFQCELCSKAFLFKCTLKEHVLSVHHHIRRVRNKNKRCLDATTGRRTTLKLKSAGSGTPAQEE